MLHKSSMGLLAKASMVVGVTSVLVGCLFPGNAIDGTGGGSSGSSPNPSTPPECSKDDDCAFRDTDNDACTKAQCVSGKCTQQLIKNTPDCQCHTQQDCTSYYGEQACSSGVCEAHKCKEVITPKGPAPKQTAGDCNVEMCDGTAKTSTKEFDVADLVDDNNPCTTEVCDAESKSLKKTAIANGTACPGGVCFAGACLACQTSSPTCGSEGPGEPGNNTTPASYTQFSSVCGYSNGTDVDWYKFYADDGALSFDQLRFQVWSTASEIELCMYAKCKVGTGVPESGYCSPMMDGPNGSRGCCWRGPSSTLAPKWDLRCTGTTEDSADIYVSVKTPNGSACERYAINGGY